MTRREIVIEALKHRETRPIPYNVSCTEQAKEKLIVYTKDPGIMNTFGNYIISCSGYDGRTPVPGRQERFRDVFGVIWNCSGADKDIGVIEDPLIEDLEDYDYQMPEPDIGLLRERVEHMLEIREDRFCIVEFGFSMFERSWTLMGMENVLAGMITCPDELEELYDKICEYYLTLVKVAVEYDVDAVYFGDDWGQQKGLIMGPNHWRRFIKPRMARLYEAVKEKNKYVIQHSCGDCHEIFPDLLEIGLDCYQTFQPEIYDITRIKKEYGHRLSFWGGISTQRALPFMTPEEIQEETVRIIKLLRKDGGLIIAPTHAVPGDVPPENIMAMLEVFRNQDKYL